MIQRFFACQLVRLSPICTSMMCALMAVMVSVSSSVAMAQDDLRPPKSNQDLGAPKVIIYIVLVLLVGAVVFIATRKSKRTHQD